MEFEQKNLGVLTNAAKLNNHVNVALDLNASKMNTSKSFHTRCDAMNKYVSRYTIKMPVRVCHYSMYNDYAKGNK